MTFFENRSNWIADCDIRRLELYHQQDIASAIVVLDGCGPNLRQGFLDKKNTSGSEQSALGDVFRTAVVEFSATVIEVTRNARGMSEKVRFADTPYMSRPRLGCQGLFVWRHRHERD